MRIEFKTRDYEWTHGHAPRGRGYWGFELDGHEFWAYGTLTEAKKACRAEITEKMRHEYIGTVYVNVMP